MSQVSGFLETQCILTACCFLLHSVWMLQMYLCYDTKVTRDLSVFRAE